MAFVANTTQQLILMDSTFNLTEREKRFLEKSWAKIFAEKVFPAIDENIFSPLYSDKASRPNTPVNVIVGALILKEALGDTDDELVEALMFDIRYQYALHTTSFEEQPLSDRTLSRFRARVLAYETEHDVDLIHKCVVKMAKEIAEFMNLSPNMQRMDSMMIAANIKNLSLLELFYTCVANLAKIMKQRDISLPEEKHHYIEKDDYNRCIYHKRELDATERTVVVMHDAEKLIEICDKTGELDDTSEYQLLIRLLKERTIIDDDGSRRLRQKEEVENPYRFDDGSFIVADGAFNSEMNSQMAASHNLKLVTTNFTGRKPDEIYADFKFTEDGRFLIECIHGCTPTECTYDSGNERSVAYFKTEQCNSCPYKERCNPRFLKDRVRKEVSWKSVGRAKQLQYMKTEEFSKYARFRNGVEAIPSLLRRRYNVDKIPTGGKNRSRFHFGFKIAALDFQKLLDYVNGLENYAQKTKTA